MDVNGGDVPTLGLRLTLDGVDKAVADMGKVGDAGDATAKRVENAGKDGGSKFQQAFQQNLGKSLADAKTFGDMLTTQFDADMARIREGQARGFIDPAAAKKAGAEAAIAYNTGLLTQLDQLGANGQTAGNSAVFRDLANSIKTVGESSDTAFSGVGRIRQGLTSLAAQGTGTLPVLDRIGASFLTMGVGNPVMIGLLAGVAAVGFAYKALTSDTDKAREAQEKETKALEDWYRTQELGKAGERQVQIENETKALAANEKQLQSLTATLAQQQTTYNAKTGLRDDSAIASTQDQIAKVSQAIQNERDTIAKANQDVVKSITDTFVTERDTQIQALADRLRYNAQDEAARQQALTLLKQDQALYAQYLKAPVTPETTALVADYARQLQQLDEILNPKQHAPSAAAANNPVIVGLQKQLEELQKVNAENNKELAAGDARIAMLHAEGVAREYLSNQAKAEAEQLDAYAHLSGAARTDRLQAIAAEKQQADQLTREKAAQDDVRASMALLNAQIGNVSAIGAHNTAITQQQTDAYAQLSNQIGGDLIHALDQFARSGEVSWTSFFHAAESLSSNLVSQITSDLEKMTKAQQDATKKGQSTLADALGEDIKKYQKYSDAVKAIGIGLSAGSVGYGIGQSSGSSAVGAVGGAVSGAIAGSSFGPIGTAVGALAGLTGGLLGGAAAAKQRKAAEDALRASIEDSTLALKVQAGTASSVAQQIAQINDAAKKNHDDIDKAYAGLKNQPQRESLFASNETDRLDAITKLSTDFWSGIQQQLNALNGPAGDLANQLATLKAAYDANELSAHDLGASTAQLAEIQDLYDQSVAAAQKAYADAVAAQKKANDDVTASLAVRNAKALGQNDLADTLQQQIDQASELYDEQQKGLDAATIAAQQYTDALEQSALVAAQAEAALQRLISGIKQDQGVYGYTDQQALDKEAAAYGFGGLSRDQVLAKYVAHDHDLSAADQSLDNEITQYLADYDKVHGAVTGAIAAVASAAQSNAVTSQVQSDIAGISESTGSREADFLQSIDVHVRSLDTYITGNHGGVGVTFRGASGAILPGANSQSAVQSQSFSGATINFTMTGNVYLQDGSQVPQAKNALVAAMNQGLGNKTRRDKLATGNADRSS